MSALRIRDLLQQLHLFLMKSIQQWMKWSSPNNATALNKALAISGAQVSFPKAHMEAAKMRFGAESSELGNCFSFSGCTEFVPIWFYKLYLAIKFKLFSEKMIHFIFIASELTGGNGNVSFFWKRNLGRWKLTKAKEFSIEIHRKCMNFYLKEFL